MYLYVKLRTETRTCKELGKFKPAQSEEQRLPTPLFGKKHYFCYLSTPNWNYMGRSSGLWLVTRGGRKELPGHRVPATGRSGRAAGSPRTRIAQRGGTGLGAAAGTGQSSTTAPRGTAFPEAPGETGGARPAPCPLQLPGETCPVTPGSAEPCWRQPEVSSEPAGSSASLLLLLLRVPPLVPPPPPPFPDTSSPAPPPPRRPAEDKAAGPAPPPGTGQTAGPGTVGLGPGRVG